MFKSTSGPAACQPCPFGTSTVSSTNRADHDSVEDCREVLSNSGKVTIQSISASTFTDGLTRERDGIRYPYRLLQTGTLNYTFNWMYIDLVKDWGDGDSLCQAAGGYLASIKSPEDAEVVRQLMALTAEPSAYDAQTSPDVPIRSIAFIGARLYTDNLFRWQDGSEDVLASPNYEVWAPGAPRDDENRVTAIAAINEQNSKVYFVDWYWGYSNYQIGAICKLRVTDSGNKGGWPLNPGLFPRSETVSGGLSTFLPDFTINEDFTAFTFKSEESPKLISLITSGTSGMTFLGAAQLCQDKVPGGRLFTWEYRRQLEEVGQAMNAVAFRYLTSAVAETKNIVWINLYQPPGQSTELNWRDRKWYSLPADVSSISVEDLLNAAGSEDNRVPTDFLYNEAPFQSFAPNDIDSEFGSCAYLALRTNIKRAAWLEDHYCTTDSFAGRPYTWAACESSG
eukprot:gene9570-9732_t